ncbi:phosphate transport system regulatory protein PhoU [Corynebacterium yudongzhengii]|uniref:Phosphate-specific transport system accessory protein PhoU n=1 Tax=Corynebacterium yudongzhengii TaxID=2080740 RepID=A0A2U1T5S2_9CORY|nr:phosphate signaling complex protein PhoU [Corynebacterium yudongzhengii]AWB82579.1 phosphate transport system regulatory protein PhoU [Corynebacterium yudongzhengii]PWC01313.1 phosphate transport system regulatory protein PhoU [Corynebacterium yudongzhengii]
MRTAYRSELDDFAEDLITMCDSVRGAMDMAARALVRGSLQQAEEALSQMDHLEEIRQRCEERAVQLLALEAPVASDLRQVISSIYIVEDFDRMAALSMHIAKAARRQHPNRAIPEFLVDDFSELARLVDDMADKTRQLLVEPDQEIAFILARDDDAVDEVNDRLLTRLTQQDWEGTVQEAVDTALLLRFFERWADHCVNVASRIVFLITGFMPDQIDEDAERDQAEVDIVRRFEDIQHRFAREYRPGSGRDA